MSRDCDYALITDITDLEMSQGQPAVELFKCDTH